MNRATAGRSELTPLGNLSREYVNEQNVLVARWVVLMLVAVAYHAAFLMEHPGSTIVHLHPAMHAMAVLREPRLLPPPAGPGRWVLQGAGML
jgi:hypothetical protein